MTCKKLVKMEFLSNQGEKISIRYLICCSWYFKEMPEWKSWILAAKFWQIGIASPCHVLIFSVPCDPQSFIESKTMIYYRTPHSNNHSRLGGLHQNNPFVPLLNTSLAQPRGVIDKRASCLSPRPLVPAITNHLAKGVKWSCIPCRWQEPVSFLKYYLQLAEV